MNGRGEEALAAERSDARRADPMDDDALADFLAGGIGASTPATQLTAEPSEADDQTLVEMVGARRVLPAVESLNEPIEVLDAIEFVESGDFEPEADEPASKVAPTSKDEPVFVALEPSLQGSFKELLAATVESAREFASAHPKEVCGVAVLLLVLILWPGASAPLPEYAIEGPFGGQENPGAAFADPMFAANDTFRVVMRPVDAAEDPPDAWFVAVGPGGAFLLEEKHVSVDERGVVRLEAKAKWIFQRPGRYTIYAAVGVEPEEPLTTPPDTIQFQVESDGGYWGSTRFYYRP